MFVMIMKLLFFNVCCHIPFVLVKFVLYLWKRKLKVTPIKYGRYLVPHNIEFFETSYKSQIISILACVFFYICLFVAASHQTRLDTWSKVRRPIKVGIKRRGRSGTSRDSNPACLCFSSAHLVQCEPDEASSFTNPNVGPGTYPRSFFFFFF